MDKSVTKGVQLLVKILDNTTTIYMLFGSLGCYPKDHTKSMQIRLAPNLYNKIRLLSTYLPTHRGLKKPCRDCFFKCSADVSFQPGLYLLCIFVNKQINSPSISWWKHISQQLSFSVPTFIRGRIWLVDNPRGKLLNQSDHSSYFTVRNQLEDVLCHRTFLFWGNGNQRNNFRRRNSYNFWNNIFDSKL